jgi:hypothetical protein
VTLDFNRACLSSKPISTAINELIERSEPLEENFRQYLGASAIGSECLRQIQYNWLCDSSHSSRILDIFRRGHLFEELTRQHLIAAGFKFAPKEKIRFDAVGGTFRGKADGIFVSRPGLPDIRYPCLWECKCLGAKGWRALERDGVEKAYPQYAVQIWIYQAYLDVTEHPAILTAVNSDTCERLHLLVPFNAEQAQQWSDRAVTIIEATRAGEFLPRFNVRASRKVLAGYGGGQR